MTPRAQSSKIFLRYSRFEGRFLILGKLASRLDDETNLFLTSISIIVPRGKNDTCGHIKCIANDRKGVVLALFEIEKYYRTVEI